jgi:hypothetical protein
MRRGGAGARPRPAPLETHGGQSPAVQAGRDATVNYGTITHGCDVGDKIQLQRPDGRRHFVNGPLAGDLMSGSAYKCQQYRRFEK